jgi:hypothetical protein
MRAVGPSRFWVAGRRVPEPNEDAVRLAPAFAYLPHAFKEAGWQGEERQGLQAAILAAVKARLLPLIRPQTIVPFSNHVYNSGGLVEG